MARLRTVVRLALAPLVVWGIYLLRANVWFKVYPAVMVALALSVFSVSLFKTPMVEVLARKTGEVLDARGVAYCRNVTRAWVAFLSVHLAVTLATVFAPYEVWALYNGFVAYVLIGAMFLAEWLIRRKVKRGIG